MELAPNSSEAVARVVALAASAPRLNEADTRALLVDPILAALGWAMDDPSQVRREFNVYDGTCLDYALLIEGKPALFVEAKALGRSLDSPQHVAQVVNYGNNEGVRWCVLTDGRTWDVYDAFAPVRMPDKLVARIHLEDLDAASALDGISLTSVASGAIETWVAERRTLGEANRRARPPDAPPGTRGPLVAPERSADPIATFDERLGRVDGEAVAAAEKLAEWAQAHGWTCRTKGHTSRVFMPPNPRKGECGLRIHFESTGHLPALEFDLETLRSGGDAAAADAVRIALNALAGRRLVAKFPSLRYDVIAERWNAVERTALEPYALARARLDAA
jgi:hypothetical protein